MLLSREISIPSRKVLKSPPLHRFASTGWLTPGAYRFKGDPCSRATEGWDTLLFRDVKRQSGIRSGGRLGNSISKEV